MLGYFMRTGQWDMPKSYGLHPEYVCFCTKDAKIIQNPINQYVQNPIAYNFIHKNVVFSQPKCRNRHNFASKEIKKTNLMDFETVALDDTKKDFDRCGGDAGSKKKRF